MSCEMRSMMTSYFFGSSMRMPPIFTNSAETPAVFMPLIFSTKAGGKVFSMPKRIPIFFTVVLPLKILYRHTLPEWPVVLAVVAVNIEPVGDAFAVENRGHLYIGVEAHVPVRRSEHNFHLPDAAQEPVVAHIRKVIRRIVEVDVVVVVTVEEAFDLKTSAHRDAGGNQIGMAHGKIECVITAEAASGNGNLRGPVFPFQIGQELIDDVALVLHVTPDASSGMRALVVPALAVDAFDAEDLYFARFELPGERTDHA